MSAQLRSDGFTLVEVLVSFVILSLVAITAFGLLGQSFTATAKVEEQQVRLEQTLQILRLREVGAEVPAELAEGFRVVETPLRSSSTSTVAPVRIQIYAEEQLLLDSIVLRKSP